MLKTTLIITKRQLGILALVMGSAALIGVLGYDVLGFGDPQGGFGPSQKIGLLMAIGTIALGLSLIPLGNRPA